MEETTEIDHEMTSFISFGRMLSEESRSDMVETIFNFFYDPAFQAFDHLKTTTLSDESENWRKIVERYMHENINRILFIGNEKLSRQVTKEFIEWVKRTYNELVKKDETIDEKNRKKEYEDKFKELANLFSDMTGVPSGAGGTGSNGKGTPTDESENGSGIGDGGDTPTNDVPGSSESSGEGTGETDNGDDGKNGNSNGNGNGTGETTGEFEADAENETIGHGAEIIKELELLLKDLNWLYPGNSDKWDYFKNKAQELISSIQGGTEKEGTGILEEFEALLDMIYDEWEKQLGEKKDEQENENLNNYFDQFIESINQKYTTINRLYKGLGPILDYLGDHWGLDEGLWQHVDWSQLEQYARILEKEEALQELAELLGRAKESEMELEEEKMKRIEYKDEWKVDPASKSEIIGIHNSDDLCNLLPSEVALLSNPATEVIFSKKFVEKKLLTFQYQGEFRIGKEEEIEEIKLIPNKEKKGPIICCIDTSGSMQGTPERVAKSIVFALLKIALCEGRKCYLITFSTGIRTIELSDLSQNIDELIDFLGMGFYGGTDSTPALNEALKMLDVENFKKADILVVSDFVMPRPDEDTIKKINEQRDSNGTRFHSLLIGSGGNRFLQDLFDTFWQYETLDGATLKKIIRDIQVMGF